MEDVFNVFAKSVEEKLAGVSNDTNTNTDNVDNTKVDEQNNNQDVYKDNVKEDIDKSTDDVINEQNTEQERKVVDYVEYIKNLGFEKEEDLKSSLNELNSLREKLKEYEEKKPYYEELENEFEEFVKANDPANIFPNQQEYEYFLMAKKLGQNEKNVGVVQKIIRNDLSKISDLDVVNLQWQYETPRFIGQDDYVKKGILKQLGVEIDDPDFDINKLNLTPDQDLQLARMAQQARDYFNKAKSDIQRPETKDFKKIFEEKQKTKAEEEKQIQDKLDKLAQNWNEKTKGIVDSLSKIEFRKKDDKGNEFIDFSFTVDDEFKKEIPGLIMHHVLLNGLEPTQGNVEEVKDLVWRVYMSRDNLQKIVEAHTNKKLEEFREKLDRERYNGRGFNMNTPPPEHNKDKNREINDEIKKLFNIKI